MKEALPGLDAATRYVDVGPEGTLAEASTHGRLGSAARTTLFRLLKPYTVRHREFEQAVLTAISALESKVDELQNDLQNELQKTADAMAEGDSELFDRIARLEQRVSAFEGVTERALERLAVDPVHEKVMPPEREPE